jgi:hypothetical protein
VKTGANPPVRSSVFVGKGTLIVGSASPWAGYESLLPAFLKSKADTLGGRMYFMGASNTERYLFARVGKDSVRIANTHEDVYVAKVDKKGRIPARGRSPARRSSRSRASTSWTSTLVASYAAREQAGAGVGMLSPRDTVRVGNAGGATIAIDYSRPSKRGRAVYGASSPTVRCGAPARTPRPSSAPTSRSTSAALSCRRASTRCGRCRPRPGGS